MKVELILQELKDFKKFISGYAILHYILSKRKKQKPHSAIPLNPNNVIVIISIDIIWRLLAPVKIYEWSEL